MSTKSLLESLRDSTRISRGEARSKFFERMDRAPISFLIAIDFLFMLGAFAGDICTGVEIRFFPAYFFSIVFAAWFIGVQSGYLTAAMCLFLWQVSEILGNRAYTNPVFFLGNFISMAVAFGIVAFGTGRIKKDMEFFRRLSSHDGLTGLPNGVSFRRSVQLEADRQRRHPRPLSIAFVDLDNFKAANDSFGHAAGDELLRTIGNLLVRNTRRTDTPARLGGDEFAILLPETDEKGAMILLEKIRKAMAEQPLCKQVGVTPSIGLVVFPRATEKTEAEMIALADELMYEAKSQGKNRVATRVIEVPEEACTTS